MDVSGVHLPLNELGLKGSPTKVKATYNKEYSSNHDLIDGLDAKEAANVIIQKLKERHIF